MKTFEMLIRSQGIFAIDIADMYPSAKVPVALPIPAAMEGIADGTRSLAQTLRLFNHNGESQISGRGSY